METTSANPLTQRGTIADDLRFAMVTIVTHVIGLLRLLEQELWGLRASWDPRYAGSALIAYRLDLATLVECLCLDQFQPAGLQGAFTQTPIPADLIERCRYEFQRRLGREIELADFNRSRVYWQQYEREHGKPAYIPIGLQSIRSAIESGENPALPPLTQATASEAVDETIHQIFSGKRDEPYKSEAPKPTVNVASPMPDDAVLRDDWYTYLLPAREPVANEATTDTTLPEDSRLEERAERVVLPSRNAN